LLAPAFRLSELRDRLGGEIRGDSDPLLDGVASLDRATERQLGFVVGPAYLKQAQASRAGALLIGPRLVGSDLGMPYLLVENPHVAFARATALFNPEPAPRPGIHPCAIIDLEATLGECCVIGPGVVVEAGARIGPRTRIEANTVIGRDVVIGADCRLYANVTVYHGCRLGERVMLHAGCVIGADGFGLAWDSDRWVKVPQIGTVIIGDDVEIGAGTTVDRGALDDTVIEAGVKIDNQVQIGHNCHIGAHTAIAGCVGIAGSTRIGERCRLGGGVVIMDHYQIADDVTISAGGFVAKDILKAGTYTGIQPIMAHADWRRNAAQIRHLADLRARLGDLEKRFDALTDNNKDK
jgi:UDP-3-O-[3-hydroxymyristoyl] glucosamine N-acyltransferase